MTGKRSQSRKQSSTRYSNLSKAGQNLMKSMRKRQSIRPLSIRSVKDSSRISNIGTPKIQKK